MRVERRDRKDSAITTLREAATASTLRYRYVPYGKAYTYVMTSF
ncbi:hypothetical protein [Fortiea sp. LEGE XX443]|nr:hypothetical protein [Fortiea sp. LEGE XX443]